MEALMFEAKPQQQTAFNCSELIGYQITLYILTPCLTEKTQQVSNMKVVAACKTKTGTPVLDKRTYLY